jgi:hypothetical protein
VGVASGDQDGPGIPGQRQERLLAGLAVLEQDEGFPDGLSRQVAVLLFADLAGEAVVSVGVLEQAHGELDTEDPTNGVVNPAQRDGAVLHQGAEVVDELRVCVWDHDLKDAIDRILVCTLTITLVQ